MLLFREVRGGGGRSGKTRVHREVIFSVWFKISRCTMYVAEIIINGPHVAVSGNRFVSRGHLARYAPLISVLDFFEELCRDEHTQQP